jgi:hypothetical protein
MAVNRLVPHLPWFILIALSILLYKERIFADSGFYITNVINSKFFWIECQRIVLAISQLLPLAGIWAGIDIRYVLILYSVSHVLFFYTLFLFVYYGLRDRRSGLLIILSQIVGIIYSFFTPMFELYYGVPLLITFYAVLRLNIRASLITLILLVLEALILLSHPLAFMLFIFLLLYDFRMSKPRPVSLYLTMFIVFAGIIVLKAYTMCPYEIDKLSWQFDFQSNRQYLQMLDPDFYLILGGFLLQYYGEVIAALIIVILMLSYQREWFRLLLVGGTFLVYLFLVCSVYTIDHSRYMEQVMFPLIPVVFIPLVYNYPKEPRPGMHNIVILLVSGLIAYRLFMIYDGSALFVARTQQMENLIKSARQMGGSKFVLSEENVDKGYTQLNWSYPLETILISAIDGNDLTVTIVPKEDYQFQDNSTKLWTDPQIFLFRRWEIKEYSWLNNRYFHLDPGGYKMLCDTAARQNLQEVSRHIRIGLDAKKYYKSMDTVWIKVTVVNKGKEPLRAGKGEKVFLSYFWMKGNDYLDWNGILTPLETDVMTSLTQDVRVAIPKVKGNLRLKVDIVTDDRNWMGINAFDDVYVY